MTIAVNAGVFRSRRRLYLMSRRNASIESSLGPCTDNRSQRLELDIRKLANSSRTPKQNCPETKAPSRRRNDWALDAAPTTLMRLMTPTASPDHRSDDRTANREVHVPTDWAAAASPTTRMAMVVVADHAATDDRAENPAKYATHSTVRRRNASRRRIP